QKLTGWERMQPGSWPGWGSRRAGAVGQEPPGARLPRPRAAPSGPVTIATAGHGGLRCRGGERAACGRRVSLPGDAASGRRRTMLFPSRALRPCGSAVPRSLTRRTTLAGAALAATATAVGLPTAHGDGDPAGGEPGAGSPVTKSAPSSEGFRAASDWGPEQPHPWGRPRASGRTLRRTSPHAAGLAGEVLERLPGIIQGGPEPGAPRFAAASALVATQGSIVYEHSDGYALRWKNAEEQLPRQQCVPARDDTSYDTASISKIFTATAVLQLVEQGRLGLEDTVATHLPRFAHGG